MALPIRTQIRNAVATLLTGLATTGSRVFASRVHPLTANDLPALLVYARDEQVEYITSTTPREQVRVMSLEVRGVLSAVTGADDTADLIAQEVESAMASDSSLGGLVARMDITSIEIVTDQAAESTVANVVMSYDLTYNTVEGVV